MTDHRTLARSEFWTLAETARTQGRDLAEVLDRSGVLLTPQRRNQIHADICDSLAETLETSPPSVFMLDRTTKAPATIYDLLHGLSQTLREQAKTLREQS